MSIPMETPVSDVAQLADAAVIRLHPEDNVVVASGRIAAGQRAENVAALQAIPSGHKMATRSIAKGEAVLKYGQAIGAATQDIQPGAHVHEHNLAVSDLRRAAETGAAASRRQAERSFMGYPRARRKGGVRN